jgi:hypothetical protein
MEKVLSFPQMGIAEGVKSDRGTCPNASGL